MAVSCCLPLFKVVPLALVILLTGWSLVEAESHLKQQPIVREAVAQWMW